MKLTRFKSGVLYKTDCLHVLDFGTATAHSIKERTWLADCQKIAAIALQICSLKDLKRQTKKLVFSLRPFGFESV